MINDYRRHISPERRVLPRGRVHLPPLLGFAHPRRRERPCHFQEPLLSHFQLSLGGAQHDNRAKGDLFLLGWFWGKFH